MATSVLGLKTFAASDPVDYNEVNDNYVKIDNGVKTAMQGRAAHNLLDNSDFRNPVNQRGASSYSTTGNEYTIDRWKTQYNTGLTVENGYINVIGGWQIYQILKNPKDGVYTFAVEARINAIGDYAPNMDISGEKDVSFDANIGEWKIYTLQYDVSTITNETISLSISARGGNNSGSISVRWAAFYKGSYTADTLPAYVPKGYAAELAECRRYYKVIDVNVAPWLSESTTLRRYYVGYEPMRTAPTVDVSGLKEYAIWTDLGSALNPYNIKNNRVLLSATSETTSKRLYIGGSIALSADL